MSCRSAARPPCSTPCWCCSRSISRGLRSPSPAPCSASSASCSEPATSARAETLKHRTVVVMPIYNESAARTFAALAAIRESVEATGLGAHFDYFIVSDTTNPDIWIAEERAFLALRERLGPDSRVYYRHRPKNHHRKAGNIADFVTRWGGALRAHGRARRRQPDDRHLHRRASPPRWRPIPMPASSSRCR